MTACPLCRAPAPPPFLVRDAVPVHQNLTEATAEAARAVATGKLHMTACEICGFVFNQAFDPALLRYGPDYDNTQSLSTIFDAHLHALAAHLVEDCGVRNARIVEIGSGKGHFLRRLIEWPGACNTGIGFDPAYVGPDEALGGRLQFRRQFYDADCADIAAEIVICRHVIEHIADPLALLATVGAALRQSPGARLFFETPEVRWSFHHRVVWDFFYEHCSLFSAASLANAFAQAGFSVQSIRTVFGDQYLWLEATIGTASPSSAAGDIAVLARGYGESEPGLLAQWRDRLTALAAGGRVALWGAGAKGVTFARLADPAADTLDCLVDINPAKQGRFVPGTGHPIVEPAALVARGVRWVVVMNPAYRAEVAAMLPPDGSVRLADWEF